MAHRGPQGRATAYRCRHSRDAGQGTPTSGRHSLPEAGGGTVPTSGMAHRIAVDTHGMQARERRPPVGTARRRRAAGRPQPAGWRTAARRAAQPRIAVDTHGMQARERRPLVGTACRRRAAGRTPSSEVAPSRRESQSLAECRDLHSARHRWPGASEIRRTCLFRAVPTGGGSRPVSGTGRRDRRIEHLPEPFVLRDPPDAGVEVVVLHRPAKE